MNIKISYGIIIDSAEDKKGGNICSNLVHAFSRLGGTIEEREQVKKVVDTLESFILAIHCAGIDIQTDQFQEALRTTVESVANNL